MEYDASVQVFLKDGELEIEVNGKTDVLIGMVENTLANIIVNACPLKEQADRMMKEAKEDLEWALEKMWADRGENIEYGAADPKWHKHKEDQKCTGECENCTGNVIRS